MIGYDPQHAVVYDDNKLLIPHCYHSPIAGSASGCLTRFICHPLDVLKIRFQLQIEPISKGSSISKYRSLPQTFSCIIKEESVTALWKGHVSGQILSAIYGVVYFSSYDLFTKVSYDWLMSHDEYVSQSEVIAHWKPVVNFTCGSLSGFCSTVLSHPFDVVRTRMVSQSEPKTYLSTKHAFQSMIKFEKLPGLYRGFVPTISQIMPFSGAQFASYTFFKELWSRKLEHDYVDIHFMDNHDLKINNSFICGAMSGTVAKLITYPLDLIKKRLQIKGFEHARGSTYGHTPYYQSMSHCIMQTFRNENFFAFYKGLVPSLLKATITTALNFWLYENAMVFLKNLNK